MELANLAILGPELLDRRVVVAHPDLRTLPCAHG